MRRCDLATDSEKEVSWCQMTKAKHIARVASGIRLLNILGDSDENTIVNKVFRCRQNIICVKALFLVLTVRGMDLSGTPTMYSVS